VHKTKPRETDGFFETAVGENLMYLFRLSGNCVTDEDLRLHNITSKSALFHGSKNWTINRRDAPQGKRSSTKEIFKAAIGTYNTGPPKKV
jgi:hypothetical protein